MTDRLAGRLAALDARMGELGSVLVAFSGGVDSAFLLAAAVRCLGSQSVLAATSTGASLADGEWAAAHRFAQGLGVAHVAITTDELQRDGYRTNGPDRCYHCKSALGDELNSLAQQRGIAYVATGTNADDLAAPHRPGLAAAAERGVVTPLADAGLTKADIRKASRRWGLTTWDKPQAACLASRVAYGVHVQPQRLARIDRAEAAVRAELARVGVPVSNVRVRDLGDRASIEIDPEWVAAASDRCDLGALVQAVGFTSAAVDRHGFRTGALNERLSPTERLPGHLNRSSWDLPVVD